MTILNINKQLIDRLRSEQANKLNVVEALMNDIDKLAVYIEYLDNLVGLFERDEALDGEENNDDKIRSEVSPRSFD